MRLDRPPGEKPRAYITRPVMPAAVRALERIARVAIHRGAGPVAGTALPNIAREVEALITMPGDDVGAEVFAAGSRLRIVAHHAVGFDNIDIDAATAHGVLVTNTPGVLTDTTADLTWALMLATARRVAEGDRLVRAGKWTGWEPTQMLGTDIHGATLGIIGLGQIGAAVARRAKGFGMRILYHSRTRTSATMEKRLGATYASFNKVLTDSDVVSLHCPLTNKTRHLIGAGALKRMKNTAILINTTRGPVVDEKALAAALKKGTIAGAGLDVYEREPAVEKGLRALDNVVLAPHLGSATVATREAMGLLAVQNIAMAFAGKKPANLVNKEVWRQRRK